MLTSSYTDQSDDKICNFIIQLTINCHCSERPRYTAARECYEETLGVLGQTDHLVSLLENSEQHNVFEVSNLYGSMASHMHMYCTLQVT